MQKSCKNCYYAKYYDEGEYICEYLSSIIPQKINSKIKIIDSLQLHKFFDYLANQINLVGDVYLISIPKNENIKNNENNEIIEKITVKNGYCSKYKEQ